MRVLHIDTGREMRGGQWQALFLIKGLAAEGVESRLLTPAGSPLFTAAAKAGIAVEAPSPMRVFAFSRRCDLVHAHTGTAHTIAAMAGGAPLLVSRRVAFSGRNSAISRWKYGRAARYIAVSQYVAAMLAARGVPESKISVVYDGVPLLEPVAPRGDRPRVIAPANAADPQKGAELARSAAVLAGVDLEFSADLPSDLPGASLFLYITRSEGLGSGALLAMSAGVPVIASKVGGLPEIVVHGENGLLVDNSPESIAAAMREILNDPAEAARMGAAGRRAAEERFTLGHMVRGTLEVYRKTLL